MIRIPASCKHLQNHAIGYAFMLILVACFYVYYPGSSGAFIFDDIPNIVANPDIDAFSLQPEGILRSAFSSFSGPLKRPVSMLTFAINYKFAGFDPYPYKLTNIVIHLVNGVLVSVFTFLLLRQFRLRYGMDARAIGTLSLAVSAVWLLHPINLTTVLYVIQRMNGLATLFTLAGLVFYVIGRTRIQQNTGGKMHLVTAFFICGPLAILSKENGVLLYLYILLTEMLVFERHTLAKSDRLVLFGCYLPILVAVIVAVTTVLKNPQWILDGYMNKDFTPVERLLTEARVIWFYAYLVFIPDIQQMSLHHDGIALSRNIIEPATTLAALVGLLVVLTLAIHFRKTYPLFAYGLLFFLAGHSLESTFLPLVIAFEHRNYLPSFGLILILCNACLHASRLQKTLPARQLFLVLFIVILAFATNIRARQWGNTELLRFYELRHNPDSPQVNYEVGRFYAAALDTDNVQDRDLVYGKAEYYFSRVLALSPRNIEAIVGLLILEASNRNTVNHELFSRLYDVLAVSQVSSTGVGAIKGLLTCQVMKECSFPEGTIDRMLRSIEVNRNITKRKQELIYNNFSRYYYDRDMQRSLEMAKKALAVNRDSLDMRMNIIRLLIDMNRYDEAQEELRIMEQADKFGIYKSTTNQLKQMIMNQPGHADVQN